MTKVEARLDSYLTAKFLDAGSESRQRVNTLKNWERLATSKIHCRPESYSHFASVKLVGFEKLKILTI